MPHASSLLLLYAALSWALAQDAAVEIPTVTRHNFSLVAGQYDIAASATPTEVLVGDPITLTVRISGTGPAKYYPDRKNLKLFPDNLTDDFHVEALPDQDKKMLDENIWEFVYRLRPRRENVAVIPGLQLLYYSPARKTFESSFSDEIPIKVKPRPAATVENIGLKTIRAPERFYQLRPVEEVVRDDSPLPSPAPALMAVLLALPPLGCCVWYRLWRKLYPNAAERRARRHSRAARIALAYLEKQVPDPPRTRAAAIDYLRQRLDLSAAEATPREVAAHLKRLGFAKSIVAGWTAFLQACDQFRFAPRRTGWQPGPAGQAGSLAYDSLPLNAEAIRLIQAVEGDPCVS